MYGDVCRPGHSVQARENGAPATRACEEEIQVRAVQKDIQIYGKENFFM